jgi:hypothetical protein
MLVGMPGIPVGIRRIGFISLIVGVHSSEVIDGFSPRSVISLEILLSEE